MKYLCHGYIFSSEVNFLSNFREHTESEPTVSFYAANIRQAGPSADASHPSLTTSARFFGKLHCQLSSNMDRSGALRIAEVKIGRSLHAIVFVNREFQTVAITGNHKTT